MGENNNNKQITIGFVEPVSIKTENNSTNYFARIDTGAARSSIDKKLAEELNLGPVIKEVVIKSAEGRSSRPVIKTCIILANKEISSEITIADRSHMQFPVLIGRDILQQGFIIDPSKEVEK